MLSKTHLQREQRARKYPERRQALAVISELVFAQHYVLVVGPGAANLHHLKAGAETLSVIDLSTKENVTRSRWNIRPRARKNGREARASSSGNCLICGSRVAGAEGYGCFALAPRSSRGERALFCFTIVESSRAESPGQESRGRRKAKGRTPGARSRKKTITSARTSAPANCARIWKRAPFSLLIDLPRACHCDRRTADVGVDTLAVDFYCRSIWPDRSTARANAILARICGTL